ncbi:CPBP family intramembrane glutamic endopeptidase [Furfurilactobacillus milii]|uniref:CPBP family intramembrane metalloprotease n=1 Tax=Furfurilactobacillus milii TaxID=2888272 RepID=A0A6N9I2X5_9LACO|nr:CPBP family intramembrane glutamic endopeptidase [Furfurilactobacillus milii]MYV17084.1 CPBP family intramembrane metalloprotease [Furfurilactobacillus milii]
MDNRWVKVFGTWLVVIIIALGGGAWTTHSGVSRETGIIVYEIVMFAVLFLLNRFWLHQTVYLKPTERSWRLIPLNWITVVLLGQVILLLFTGSGNLALGITMLLFVGTTEEYVFRGLLLPLASRLGHGRNQLWTGVLVSSVLFGLAHSVNALQQPVMATIVQMLSAITIGIMLSAIYLRTGSLLFPIILHGLNDFVPAFYNGSVQETSRVVSLTEVGPILLFLIVGAFMLRKSKRSTIKNVIPQ